MNHYKKICLSLLLFSYNSLLKSPAVILENSMLRIADQAGFFNEALLDIKYVGKDLVSFLKGNIYWEGIELTLEVITDDITHDLSLLFKDTALLYGATYIVISHDHPQLTQFLTKEQKSIYVKNKDIFSGSYALHPCTGKKLPIFISNYSNSCYEVRNYHAHLAVPAHAYDDFHFAKKHELPITMTLKPTEHQISVGFQKPNLSYRGVLRSPYIVQTTNCYITHSPVTPEMKTGAEVAKIIKKMLIEKGIAKEYKKRITYPYNKKEEPFNNLLKIEAFIRKNKNSFSKALYEQKHQEIKKLLSYAHEDFLALVESFLVNIQNTKQLMLPLIEESCKKRGKKESYLLKWSGMNNKEPERIRFKRDILTFIDLARFCSSLVEFLADLTNSCPHAQAYVKSLRNE